jgi:CRISPR-associated endonuclease/helicase Cas3
MNLPSDPQNSVRYSIIAHRSEDGREQKLSDHLRNVAWDAAHFAAAFRADAWGKAAGLLHDDGKEKEPAQRRLRGAKIHVDHSTPGAKYAVDHLTTPKGAGRLLAYCIAGHHTGLPDGNVGDDETCLTKRLERAESGCGYLASEIPSVLESPPILKPPVRSEKRAFSIAFFIRMIYSCLVDADFLDTELFFDPEKRKRREKTLDLKGLKPKLDGFLATMARKAKRTAVNKLRARILSECRSAASLSQGLFSLTVPTGGGKTLSSMAFAMDHADAYELRRLIYVIPYTNIIEQTAQQFRDIFGDDAVLEHHSNLIQEKENQEEEEQEERRRLASENWDAPIIVTTNVQFFESFYANRSSRTRKLHNVAGSVIVLDEAQMLPVPLLRPTLEVIRELSEHYCCSVVLCTATQPSLTVNEEFQGGLEGVREIVKAPCELEKAFARVRIVRETRLGLVKDAEIAALVRGEERCLCIVNTKKHARLLLQSLGGIEGTFHLSAAMCPMHRKRILGSPKEPKPGTIRRRLLNREPCRVVSTQLVEAGVDVDFPVVIRAMAGVDSLVQASGRCNREGNIAKGGRFYVFTPEEGIPPGHFRQNAQITELVLHDSDARILDSNTVRSYFRELYWLKDRGGALDVNGIMTLLAADVVHGNFPFKTVAGLYRLIPDSQVPIIVPYDETAAMLCRSLRYNKYPGAILRKLQPYTINVYTYLQSGLKEAGYIEGLQDDRYFTLTELGMKESYDEHFGLNPDIRVFHEAENMMF